MKPIVPVTLSTVQTGAVTAYPQLTFADVFTAPTPFRIVGIDISASLGFNPLLPTSPNCGVFVVVGQKEATLTLDQQMKIAAMLLAGRVANLVFKSKWVPFGDYFVDVPPLCPVSLYVCGGALAAGAPLCGLATLHLIPGS